jgi:hypothetical protein
MGFGSISGWLRSALVSANQRAERTQKNQSWLQPPFRVGRRETETQKSAGVFCVSEIQRKNVWVAGDGGAQDEETAR